MHPKEGNDILNFWPSFADTMLSFVLVFVVILGAVAIVNRETEISLAVAYRNQDKLISQVATETNLTLSDHSFVVNDSVCLGQELEEPESECVVSAERDYHLLTLRFSNQVLFASDDYRLTSRGTQILSQVGEVVKAEACNLYRIQIEGHTDNMPTSNYNYGNLQLGAMRSMAVYTHLSNEVGLDPIKNLMSVSSYGEYKPTSRQERRSFTVENLRNANKSISDRSVNRRIEIQLYYRTEVSDCV